RRELSLADGPGTIGGTPSRPPREPRGGRVRPMNREENTSASLLERVRVQDPDAWKRVVCLYGPLVLSWCQRWGVPREDAQDVLQEVFLAVSTGLAEFQRERTGGFRSWVRGITRHKVLDYHRRQRRQPAQASGGSTAQV